MSGMQDVATGLGPECELVGSLSWQVGFLCNASFCNDARQPAGMAAWGQRTNPLTREGAARRLEIVAVGWLTP